MKISLAQELIEGYLYGGSTPDMRDREVAQTRLLASQELQQFCRAYMHDLGCRHQDSEA